MVRPEPGTEVGAGPDRFVGPDRLHPPAHAAGSGRRPPAEQPGADQQAEWEVVGAHHTVGMVAEAYLQRQPPRGEAAPEGEVEIGSVVAGTDHQEAARSRVEQPGHGGVTGGAQVVQLGRGGTGDLGDEQRRVGADGGGDQWHQANLAAPDHRLPGTARTDDRSPVRVRAKAARRSDGPDGP
ncbi:hypothetical protein GCM10029963_27990 [Micromonospora andamanensis]